MGPSKSSKAKFMSTIGIYFNYILPQTKEPIIYLYNTAEMKYSAANIRVPST